MESIQKFAKLINEIPVEYQSAIVKKDVWQRISYIGKKNIEGSIFRNSKIAEISRKDIFKEPDARIKIVKILMWGFPNGGRSNNIESALKDIDFLEKMLYKIQDKDLPQQEAENILSQFAKIKGLGPSTWSKLLYFFNVSFESRKCQIFDLKIVDSLNKNQFSEFGRTNWKQNKNDYFEYIHLLDSLSQKLNVPTEKIEAFLFHYNLNYKFL